MKETNAILVKDSYVVVVSRLDGTLGAVGPFANYKVAEAYADFIHFFSGNRIVIYKANYSHHKWSKPLPPVVCDYPFISEMEICDD